MNKTQTSPIFYPYMAAREFPHLDEIPLIDRRAFIDTIADLFTETTVLFLEGEEGFGTTTTAAQFCVRNPKTAFALFIKPASRIAYSPDFLRLALAEQYSWFLDNKAFAKDVIDDSEFNHLQFRIRRKATKEKPLFFIVDGLHQIGKEDSSSLEAVFKDILPIGWEHFKFLIVGKQSEFESFLKKVPSRYYHQLKFGLPETREFLADLSLQDADVTSIYTLCDGVPGRLASVRRLLITGTTVDQIFESEPSKYLEFIKLEYTLIDKLSLGAKKLLAILAFSNRQLPPGELLAVAGVAEDALTELTEAFSFIAKNKSTQDIEFISEAHRRFASKILMPMKNEVLSAQIDYLLANPQSPVALRFLPTYYQQAGQTQELVRLLSAHHFSDLLDSTASIVSLRNRAELGIRSAAQLQLATDVFSFSIKRSVFASIASAEGARAEIRAMVALGRAKAAMALAQSCIVREERFAFLCAYARQIIESGQSCEPDVLALINELAATIEFADLGDRAIDMAIELVGVDAGLAMSIVDRATKISADAAERHFAVARVTIAATQGAGGRGIAALSDAAKQISDEKMQRFISEIVALASTLSSADAIRFSKELMPTKRLPFLCYWASTHKHKIDAVNVVEHALDHMINDSTYSPKMHDLRDLALPLAYAPPSTTLGPLINRIDGQRGLIKDLSLSIDSVSLQTTLAQAEKNINPAKAAERIVDTYYELAVVDNAEVKLECYAILLEGLRLMDQDGMLEAEHQFRALISGDMQKLLDEVLENSADHFLIVKGAIRALATADFDAAMSICGRLNVLSRRDEAFAELCKVFIRDVPDPKTSENVSQALGYIKSPIKRDQVIGHLIRTIATRKFELKKESFEKFSLMQAGCENSDIRCITMPALVEIWINSDRAAAMPSLRNFDIDLELTSAVWNKVESCFSMSTALAKLNIELGAKYYDIGSSLKDSENYLTLDSVSILLTCLSLTTRVLHGAIRTKCSIDDAQDRFLRLVDLIPSEPAKIEVICDLASKAWVAGRQDIATQLLKSRCIPAIEEQRHKNPFLARYLIKLAFPSLFCIQQQVALHYVKELNIFDIEPGVVQAFDLLLKKETRSDPPLDGVTEKISITYSDAISACVLIELLTTDTYIYTALSELCLSITAKINRNNFTRNQRADLASRLDSYIQGVLPDPSNISHVGYLVLCNAAILTLRDDAKPIDWKLLIEQGRNIANAADAGFVLYELAELAPAKYEGLTSHLRSEAISLFNSLPSPIDQINRLILVSKNSSGAGVALAKAHLKSAMLLTLKAHDEKIAERSRQRIIDIAEKISSDFADELLELIDKDPARAAARSEVQQRLATLKVKKKLANAKDVSEIGRENLKHLPEAAWMNVAGLMSGRLEVKAPELLIEYLRRSSSLPLSNAYPILAWHIENMTRKFAKAELRSSQIESLLEQILLTTELAVNLILRITVRKAQRIAAEPCEDSALVGLNNREAALDFIGTWLAQSEDQILFCDPYFGPEDVDLFKLILANCPMSEITIVTSKKILADKSALTAEAFLEVWNKMMDQDPPVTKIIGVAHAESNKSPIHDRWLISGSRGLRLGTSINSIGTGKLSEISALTLEDVTTVKNQLSKFVRGDRMIGGARIQYHSLTF